MLRRVILKHKIGLLGDLTLGKETLFKSVFNNDSVKSEIKYNLKNGNKIGQVICFS